MSHNRKLADMIVKVRDTVSQAKNEEGLLPVFDTLKRFQREVGPIKYDNTVKWGVLMGLALGSALFALTYFLNASVQTALGDFGYFLMIGGGLFTAAMGIWIAAANSEIDTVSELIFMADILFDNRLKPVPIGDSGHERYRELYKRFGDFRGRGDEGRRIEQLIEGQWQGEEHSLAYDYYRFRYVEVYYVPVTQKVGKTTVTTMQRRTRTHYRYGLIMDFPYAQGLACQSGGGSFGHYIERYETESETFNRVFSVYTDDSHAAAKFLQPAVVVAFRRIAEDFSGLNVEINREGKLNLSFNDSDLLELQRQHSIAEPELFENEIRQHLALGKLNRLLGFAETLAKYNDSNF